MIRFMKTLLIALTVLFSSQSFAAKCRVSGLVKEGSTCVRITTRFEVEEVENCKALAKSTETNRFFSIMGPNDVLINTRYTFKDRPNKVKVRETIEFRSEHECL